MELVDSLVSAGGFLHGRGWVPATSGNLSARTDEGFVITASGKHKGQLTRADFLPVGSGAVAAPGLRPSAETALHAGLYQRFPACGAVLHTHSIHAVALSRVHPEGVHLVDHELAKAFAGVPTHEGTHVVPVFPNDQDLERAWATIGPTLDPRGLPGFLLQGHGLYAWGATVPDALRHLEAFEHLFACVVLEATLWSRR